MVNDLRMKIIEYDLIKEKFCKSTRTLYGDFSNRAARMIPFPKEVKNKNIENMAELLKIYDYEPLVKTLKILLKPLKLINTFTM